ncbi:MAG: cobalamin B12-binding domain-containing protein [Chloroflexi bacterium]|nr:cobalamin B12-binding domain-containing protein [Chloroflexota bacterium]
MSDDQVLLGQLETDILNYDAAAAVKTAQAIVASGMDIPSAIDCASAAIQQIGQRFQVGDIFLPELMLAGETMKQCMNTFTPHLSAKGSIKRKGKVVIGAVAGDIHDIGKNLVATMLSVNGFEVVDLGVGVQPLKLVDTALNENAQIIALSALMTTSMPYQRDTVALLEEMGLRDKFFVVVGGGPVTGEFAREIHADGWGTTAVSAVRVCERLLESAQRPPAVELVVEK